MISSVPAVKVWAGLQPISLRRDVAAMEFESGAEQSDWLKEAKAPAQKRTDRLVRTMALSGQPLTPEAVERLYQKNLAKYLADGGDPR